MARSKTDDIIFDEGEGFKWELSFYNDDDTPVDVSSYSFSWVLNNGSTDIWTITSFTRPNNYTISFSKTSAEVGDLVQGLAHTYSFKVTGGSFTNDEFISGKAIRP